MDIIIDQQVAVLEVLAFGDAVRGNKEVDLLRLRESGLGGTGLGQRRKIGQYVVIVGIPERSAIAAVPDDKGRVDPESFLCPRGQLVIK